MDEDSDKQLSIIAVFVRLMLLSLGSLAICFLLVGKTVLEKILTELIMPFGLIWIGLFFVTTMLLIRKQFKLGIVAGLIWCLCSIAGNNYLAGWGIRSLEERFHSVDPLKAGPFEAVVLLGGSTSKAPNGQLQVNQNGDRVVLAARLYHAGVTQRILCTGTRIQGLSTAELDEAQASRILLMDLGVAESAIQILGGRNTSEEMREIADELVSESEVGIVTSAWHLPRAMALAKSEGIRAVPLPANFNGGRERIEPDPLGRVILRWIPDQSALSVNSRVMKEYLARVVGR
ncbi:MAG: YdcF family protein [Rubripirellula sp.]